MSTPKKGDDDDKELEQQAVEELLREAERGRERSKTLGVAGWYALFV